MNRLVKIALLCVSLFVAVGFVSAVDWDSIKLDQPVLVTAPGQSPDGLMVKVLLAREGIKFTLDNAAKKDVLANYKAVIMVVGYSGKGLGAAGISKEDEIMRTKSLIAEAKTKKIPIILAHIGGTARRGPSTQELLDIVAPAAYCMIFVEGGNPDGVLSGLAQKFGFPFRSCEKISSTGPLFAELFK